MVRNSTTGLSEIKELFSKQKTKRIQSYEAVEAINEAANKTTSFLQACMRKVEHSNEDLSNIWLETAKKVRYLDEEIYFRLLAKAEYWADPTVWDTEKINKANIALESIRKDAKEILKGKDSII